MTIPPALQPPSRLLLGPGPSDAHQRVLRAMATPLLGHLDPAFLAIMAEVQEMLRAVFQTGNRLTLPISATGMAGMETCLVNLVEPGDKVVICNGGFFSNRMVDVAQRCGTLVTEVKRPWGEVFAFDEIAEVVRRVKPKVLGVVHAETSTGVLQPLDGLGDLCRETGTLLVIDTVTSLACVPVKLDAWGVDAAFSCSQKGLACPPGLSPLSFSQRALDTLHNRKSKVQSWYLDLSLITQYWGQDRSYHHTGPISSVYAIHEGLRIVLEEGLENRFARHRRNYKALRAGLEALGMRYVAPVAHQLPQLNAVYLPPGISEELPVRKRLLDGYGIEIGGGLGELKGKIWRIGLMGCNSRADIVYSLLGALERVLVESGLAIAPGAATVAAQRAYGEAS